MNRGDTTTTAGGPVTPCVGQSVPLTATVAAVAPSAGTPTGSVGFLIDEVSQAPIPLAGGQASLTTSTLAVGPHSITVPYPGDANFNGSTSAATTVTVLKADTSLLVIPPVNFAPGQQVSFSATISVLPPGVASPLTGTVTFTDGGANTFCANVAINVTLASCTVSIPQSGGFTQVAAYSGDAKTNGCSGRSR